MAASDKTVIIIDDVESGFYKEKLRQVTSEIADAQESYEDFKGYCDYLESLKAQNRFIPASTLHDWQQAERLKTQWHFKLVQLFYRKMMLEEGYRRWLDHQSKKRNFSATLQRTDTIVLDDVGHILYDPLDPAYETEED